MGMSQTGAYKLAAQGYNYRQILGYYYPGVETARLELKK
jgi:SpoIID/LytB domain protein